MTQVKWHVNKEGKASVCSAQIQCPLSDAIHGASEKEVLQKFEKSMSEKYKEQLSGINKTIDNVPDNQRPRVKEEYEDRKFAVPPQVIEVPHNPDAKYAVLSDVDGTLTRGSLVLDHAIYLHEHGDIDLGNLPQKWKKDPKNEKIIVKLAEKYREQIKGKNLEDLRVDEFLDKYENNDNQFYSTMDQLKEFNRCGWEVQLISGSPNFLVQPFAERHGFYGKGSDYKTDDDGNLNGDIEGMFGGKAKQGYIEKLGISRFKRILAFGDTASDQPLFDNSHHSTLVDPSEETESMVQANIIVRD